MAAPKTTADIYDLIRKSGLIDDARLATYRNEIDRASDCPTSPRRLVGRMIDDGMVTRLQAGLLLQGKWKNFFISGKYKLLEHIGRGGMGQVYLCEHLRMGRRVAIKILPTERAEDDTCLHRFYREARAIAVLDHPNIVRAHDIDRDCKVHFLVMEYADGTNLQDIVKRFGSMPIGRAVDYVIQAACGLHHSHQNGLIHRDVKPSNLLLERNGQIKLLDLGLARFFADTSDLLTQELGGRSLIGTADFLAPEQAVDSQSADARSDIYSLGATLYYMLAGRAPFQSATIAEKLLQHQHETPVSIVVARPDVPSAIAAVIERALAKQPSDRFQSCLDLIDALMPFVPLVVPLPTAEEMPRLSPAAEHAGQPSSQVQVPELSSSRLQRSLLTPGHGHAAPTSSVATRPKELRYMSRALVAASVCTFGLVLGVTLGKLASTASAQSVVVDNYYDDYERESQRINRDIP